MDTLTETKILKDSFYGPLYKKYGLEFIKEAGWFLDTKTEKDLEVNFADPKILCTPFNYIYEQIKLLKEQNFNFENENYCVLLLTGAIAPCHLGHIEILEKTKIHLENKNIKVLGGYISPGHDEWVLSKIKNSPNYENLNINNRIKIANDLLKSKFITGTQWIQIDPWEGLFNRVAINFTEVIDRLRIYLEHYLQIKIPIYYVCGGDNSSFSLTFIEKGNCVIVNRPTTIEIDKYKEKIFQFGNCDKKLINRIFFIDNNCTLASSRLRIKPISENIKKYLNIRVEDFNDERYLKLIELFSLEFDSVRVKNVEKQKINFRNFWNYNRFPYSKNFISLDPLILLKHNLEISRVYDIFGVTNFGISNRPGSESLNEQIDKIKKHEDHCIDNKYILHDDDICTGQTIDFVIRLLKKNDIKVLNSSGIGTSPLEYETLDLRDFLVGYDFNNLNGLVIQIKDQKFRVPYIYPFVDPYIRGNIKNALKFSIDVWNINKNFHLNVSSFNVLKVLHLENTKEFFNLLGFGDNISIVEICEYYMNFLKSCL